MRPCNKVTKRPFTSTDLCSSVKPKDDQVFSYHSKKLTHGHIHWYMPMAEKVMDV